MVNNLSIIHQTIMQVIVISWAWLNSYPTLNEKIETLLQWPFCCFFLLFLNESWHLLFLFWIWGICHHQSHSPKKNPFRSMILAIKKSACIALFAPPATRSRLIIMFFSFTPKNHMPCLVYNIYHIVVWLARTNRQGLLHCRWGRVYD
jgi:hypothetical protein